MKKSVLVAGGAGFIGSWMCEHLLKEDYKVLCIDNVSTGRKKNVSHLLDNPNFMYIEQDVCGTLPSDIIGHHFDQIYHLASPASVTYVVDNPVEAADANSIGTKNLLEYAKKEGAKLLFASSSEVYGDPLVHPQKESYWGNSNPVGVRSGYDEGKRFGESLCMAYKREYSVDVKIARIFNTYGPRSNPQDSRIIPTFLRQALKNENITIHGDGAQTRSLCYVSDMVAGLFKLMESGETGPFNIGGIEEMTVTEIAERLIKHIGSRSEVIHVERPEDDPSRRKPDTSLAKDKLGWEPKVPLDKGLSMTIEYFKKELSI